MVKLYVYNLLQIRIPK